MERAPPLRGQVATKSEVQRSLRQPRPRVHAKQWENRGVFACGCRACADDDDNDDKREMWR
jgi:hypothetical protein